MFVSDINDYRTENIVHPSKNMSTYGMKFAFNLKIIITIHAIEFAQH